MRIAFFAAALVQASACALKVGLDHYSIEFNGDQYLVWGSVPVGSALAAILTKQHRLLVGTLSALAAVALFPATNYVIEELGREPHYSGSSGALQIAGLTFVFSLLLGLLGSSIGTTVAWLHRRSSGTTSAKPRQRPQDASKSSGSDA